MTVDPTTAYATPPHPKQQQEMPGETEQMAPAPDHGETTYKGHRRLSGRAAIITGSDSGIGRAVAIAFAREGADVLISYLSEEDDARETACWVEEAGRTAVLVPGDIGEEAHCKSLIERAMTEFGRLDILVNNAAHQASIASLEEITSEEWDRTIRTNLSAMFYLCKAAVPVMQRVGGSHPFQSVPMISRGRAVGSLAGTGILPWAAVGHSTVQVRLARRGRLDSGQQGRSGRSDFPLWRTTHSRLSWRKGLHGLG